MERTAHKPVLAITAGDPCGIGPEVALRAALSEEARAVATPVVIADREGLLPTIRACEIEAKLVNVSVDRERVAWSVRPGEVLLFEPGAQVGELPFGAACEAGGRASFAWVEASIRLARRGLVGGIVTAPISKSAWHMAGILAPGHTEVFADAFRARPWAMLLASPRLNVALATLHQSLASVPAALTRQRIVDTGMLLNETLMRLRGAAPRIAVLGLNPHAGEDGLMGREEIETVAPAVAELVAAGVDAEGPLPPDTAFTEAAIARYDGHLCMYHDQGLIPFKALAFDDGVNTTMGLRGTVRTSPDHGTAWAIAGKGIARFSSTVAAIRLAARLAGGNA